MSQMRTLLHGAASLRIGPAGYMFEVDAAAVDARRFEEAVTTAVAEHDPGSRLTVLDEALTFWRGSQ